jgi:hypothetical protein
LSTWLAVVALLLSFFVVVVVVLRLLMEVRADREKCMCVPSTLVPAIASHVDTTCISAGTVAAKFVVLFLQIMVIIAP